MSAVLLKIHYGNDLFSLKVKKGENLLTALEKAGKLPPTPCGGKGKCGKCIVYCLPNRAFSELTTSEIDQLSSENIKRGTRLACQTRIIEDGEVHVIPEKDFGMVEIDENLLLEEFDPFVRTKHISLADKISEPDLEVEIKKTLEVDELDFSRVFSGSGLLNKEVVVKLAGESIVSVSNDYYKSSIGVAVDLGTTTIVVALLDLETGKNIGTYSCLNPQQTFGADVISRISHIISSKEGLCELNGKVVNCINNMVEKSINESGIGEYTIDQYIVSGNATMIHILFSLPVRTIAQSPYIPFTNSHLRRSATLLGLAGETYTEVYSFPSISAFVGGDIVSGILASGLYESQRCMLVDLGTNGELVYVNEDKIFCCSTAAGPAFEGANISCGTGNVNGAIYRVRIDKNNIMLYTIGNKKPSGICGTGIISLVAELIRKQIVYTTGSFSIDNCSSDEIKSKFDYNNKSLYLTEDIFISQKDIRNFQLAKAAIRTGYDILVKLAGNIKPQLVQVAGGFGSNLNPEDVFTVGLIPEKSGKNLSPAGNTSLKGAVKLMLNRNYLHSVRDIVNKSLHFDLSSMKDFRKEYVDNLNF
ncbi:MAG: ASKHA domain-containing protein [Kosmotogaceae bacterium]